jgi:hypothetical protein
MPLPKTLKEMKFLLFPLIAIPLACIFAFNSPTREAHEAAHTATLGPQVDTMKYVAATFQSDNAGMVLFKTPSIPCDNLMGQGWHEGRIQAVSGEELTRICWRQYSDFETAWDGAHYERPIVAICPIFDGIERYMGCTNVPASRFEWQPR